MEDQEQQLIYSFPRAEGEEIQIAIRKFRGKCYVDMRIWFQSKNENVLRPTKKGVYFSLDKVSEMQKGVDRLAKATARFLQNEERSPGNRKPVSSEALPY
jgi:hypothetical protein